MWFGLFFVVYGCFLGVGDDYSWVDVNNCCFFKWVIEFFFDFGYCCIVLINGFEDMDFV